jgi:1,2-diacylglycerol 3-alpha-glucosyltransferase
MQVAYICQSYPPMISGAAIVAKRLAEAMAARKHDVLVISASDEFQGKIQQADGLLHIQLRSIPNPFRVGHKLAIWSHGNIIDILEEFEPDILHLHEPLTLGLSGLMAAKSLEIPVILTLHGLPEMLTSNLPSFLAVDDAVESGLWTYGDWFIQQCDCVVLPSQTSADKVCKRIDCEPFVISNGIDLSWFSNELGSNQERASLLSKYGLDPQLPVILHVGRLDKEKKVDVFIHAVSQTLKQVQAQVLVIGDGCERKALISLCNELGIRDVAHFPGYVDSDGDLPGLYRLAAVFGTASEIETQGLVILEALASGVPVVAVRAASIPELVHDSKNGYLVAPQDAIAMGDRIAELISSPERASEMGRAGRELVKVHAFSNSVQQYERLYQQVLQDTFAEKPEHEMMMH